MNPSVLSLKNEEIKTLQIIEALVRKQNILVNELRANLSGNSDVFALRESAPDTIHAFDETWAVAVHGAGVRFTNTKTKEVVDMHVGIFDHADAFDTWRLEEYAESIHSELQRVESIIERLVSEGVIQKHRSLAGHYELHPVHDQRSPTSQRATRI